MKTAKCEPGYITSQKKINTIWLVVFILIGAALFLFGYFTTHTRANIFTILAVLMVLPAAKRIIALIVMVPRKEVGEERYEAVRKAVGDGVILTDYVFSSTEKVVHLDFVVIKNGNVLGVKAASRQDVEYMKKYLADSVHKHAASFHVKVFDTDEQLIKQLDKLSKVEASPETEEKVVDFLRSLAV